MEYEKQVKKSTEKARAKKKPIDKSILNRLMYSYINFVDTLLTAGFSDCLLIFLTAVILLFILFHSYHLYWIQEI